MKGSQIHPRRSSTLGNNESMRHVNIESSSHDVYLLVHGDNSTVTLAESQHSGHQFFQCLAELNQGKFLQEYRQDTNARSVATSLMGSLCESGRGQIFVKDVSQANNEWTPILDSRDAAEFIFSALLDFYGLTKKPMDPADSKKRNLEQDLEAAESLLLVRTSSSSMSSDSSLEKGLQPPEPSEVPKKKRVRFDRDVVFDSNNKNGKAKRKKPFSQSNRSRGERTSSSQNAIQWKKRGIPYSQVGDHDVLCGGTSEGVLTTTNLGNLRFLAIIDASITDSFNVLATTDTSRLTDMAKVAVKAIYDSTPRGRFLVPQPSSSTNLWYEVEPQVALSMTLCSLERYSEQHVASKPCCMLCNYFSIDNSCRKYRQALSV